MCYSNLFFFLATSVFGVGNMVIVHELIYWVSFTGRLSEPDTLALKLEFSFSLVSRLPKLPNPSCPSKTDFKVVFIHLDILIRELMWHFIEVTPLTTPPLLRDATCWFLTVYWIFTGCSPICHPRTCLMACASLM